MAETSEPRVRWGWIVFVVVLGLIVVFVTGFGGGECRDASDPALSSCSSGPFIGVLGVWVAWIAYVLLAAYGLWQAFRRR